MKIEKHLKEISPTDAQQGEFLLAGDVGKTNARFRISAVSQDKKLIPLLSGSGSSATRAEAFLPVMLDNIKALLAAAREAYRICELDRAVIGVPGKISKDRQSCTIFYLDAIIRLSLGSALRELGVRKLLLLNDLEGGTWGVKASNVRQFKRIGGSSPDGYLPPERFVLGMPGSGLGMGLSLDQDIIIPSEGGNILTMIDPRDKEERGIWEMFHSRFTAVRDKREGYLTYNDITCGPGILLAAQCLVEQPEYRGIDRTIAGQISSATKYDGPVLISKLAYEGNELCKQVFKLFGRFLARVVQSICLVTLPEALVLGGRIVIENQELILPEFIRNLPRHIAHGEYLEKLPVYLIENKDLNLDGATYVAARINS